MVLEATNRILPILYCKAGRKFGKETKKHDKTLHPTLLSKILTNYYCMSADFDRFCFIDVSTLCLPSFVPTQPTTPTDQPNRGSIHPNLSFTPTPMPASAACQYQSSPRWHAVPSARRCVPRNGEVTLHSTSNVTGK